MTRSQCLHWKRKRRRKKKKKPKLSFLTPNGKKRRKSRRGQRCKLENERSPNKKQSPFRFLQIRKLQLLKSTRNPTYQEDCIQKQCRSSREEKKYPSGFIKLSNIILSSVEYLRKWSLLLVALALACNPSKRNLQQFGCYLFTGELLKHYLVVSLTVARIIQWIGKNIELPPHSPTVDMKKFIEVLCNGRVVPVDINLATVLQSYWRSSSKALLLDFRVNLDESGL